MKKKDKLYINEIIEQIAYIRANNNHLWMDLLRLAFLHSPNEARKIMRQIARNDRKITAWSARL